MPEIDFETAKRLNATLTKSHNQWGPRAAPFVAKSDSLSHFVSKIAFALDGAEPDYVSVAFNENVATVFITAGEFMYLAVASPEASSVKVFPFELHIVQVQEAPNVMRSADKFGFDALSIDIGFADLRLTLPGHNSDSNEESLAAFFPILIKHLKR